ncbi:ABC transporter substrate-binding protein [Shigella flexneri]
MRKDAKWSDGTPVTAEDFVYSWQRLADPIPPPRMRVISSMAILPISMRSSRVKTGYRPGRKAIDANTFEVTLSEPVRTSISCWFTRPCPRYQIRS